MALVDLLATEFMGSMLQGSIKFQIKCFAAALLGCAIMSVVAKVHSEILGAKENCFTSLCTRPTLLIDLLLYI
ncbi:unnamed protein product [Brassica napus]|uniref:(rape) hypothetical protein n=1 Tax=Brassica napus TaxID=3708 RepID=A0A816IJE2_BRANA|nr:unnamed protein product [Brassica napus]